MKKIFLLGFGVALLSFGLAYCNRQVNYPIVDVHSHVLVTASGASASDLVSQMDAAKVSHMVVLQEPNAVPTSESMDTIISFFSSHSSRFLFLYGGGDLSPKVHAVARPNAANLTIADIYPNGSTGSEATTGFNNFITLANDAAGTTTTFQNLANAAASSGKYKGFGEFGPYHVSRKSGQPYISYPANHSMMKWLSNLAATNSMVIDIHMEANSTTLSELADLAAYNRNTKIIWDHCGWSNTGEATASTIRTFLSENSNVYLSLKLRALENNEMRKASPFDERGRLRKEWKELFKDYADRIMVGIDNKYYSDSKSVSSTMKLTMTYYAELMSELPSDVATAVSNKTAKTLFGITD